MRKATPRGLDRLANNLPRKPRLTAYGMRRDMWGFSVGAHQTIPAGVSLHLHVWRWSGYVSLVWDNWE